MNNEKFEIVGSVEVSKDIEHRIRTTGVRGLDFEKATELGVFQRIANLLCVTHASIMAAYRIYGGVDYLIDQLNARKNDIAREMNVFDKSFERFVNFWTKYYSHKDSGIEVNFETERLYHKIMEWMQMPESWQLGEKQRTSASYDVCMHAILPDNKVFNFYTTEINDKTIVEEEKTYGVFYYDAKTKNQTSINTGLDKEKAIIVAQHLSEENPQNIYFVSEIRKVIENKRKITPVKAFMANQTICETTE